MSHGPKISIVVPTRNERDNVGVLHAAIVSAMGEDDWELLYVDDSDDGTEIAIEALQEMDPRVRLLHRSNAERSGGLGGAVLAGFHAARGDILVVMDGDMQHPPAVVRELVRQLEAEFVDLALASRYVDGGSAGGLSGLFRKLASRSCRGLAYVALPRTRGVTDPLGGFFALRSSVVSGVSMKPDGYKILLEILVRGRWSEFVEVPYVFATRHAGASKSDLSEAHRFIRHLRALRGAPTRGTTLTPAVQPLADEVRPLRVLLLTSEAPPVVSGIATTVGALTVGLTERGHTVDVVSRADFPKLVRREIRLSAFALFWPRFRRHLQHYDVVNVHGPVPTISEVFLVLAKTLGHTHRPGIVYTHHSDLAIPRLERWCEIYNRLTGHLVHVADVVVVSSEAYKDRLRTVRAPVQVVPWGIDARGKIRPRGPRETGILRVLFVGQLRPYKGLHVLIDAVSELPRVSLTIIGKGPLRAELERSVDQKGLPNVAFAGRVSDDSLWNAYSENDVVVLPSTTTAEAFGLVLAEGMASGCVPVATNLPGVREVAATGLIVEPGSVRGLREALRRLLEDPALLQRLAALSVARAQDMSADATAGAYEEACRAAMRQAAGRQAGLAVPGGTMDPDAFLARLADQIGVRHASLSLLSTRGGSLAPVRMWRADGTASRITDASVARYAATRNQPVLINEQEPVDLDLRRLLRRPELTSSIVIPVRRTRNSVSVVGLSTTRRDGSHLTRDHVQMALEIVDEVAAVS
jgi:glycosyltransferase involved in cell wall biosynthesis